MKAVVKSSGTGTNNIPLESMPVYPATSPYDLGELVQYGGFVYESLKSSNAAPLSDTVSWYLLRPTIPNAMFVATSDILSTSATDIVVTIDNVNDIDTIALFGVAGASVNVKMVTMADPVTVLWEETKTLEAWDISDWWEWTYAQESYKTDAVFVLPLLRYASKFIVTITTSAGAASCKHITWGRSEDLGCTQYGAVASMRSNVNKERKSDGHVYLTKGISWRRMSVPVMIESTKVDTVMNRLAKLDGTPTLFLGDSSGSFASLTVFGFFRDFDIPIAVSHTTYNIEIEGV